MGDDCEDDLSEAIAESLVQTDYGAILRERGITTVALDDDGQTVVFQPDDTSELLAHEQGGSPPTPPPDEV